MKKFICFLLTAILAVSMIGCNKNTDNSNTTSKNETTAKTETAMASLENKYSEMLSMTNDEISAKYGALTWLNAEESSADMLMCRAEYAPGITFQFDVKTTDINYAPANPDNIVVSDGTVMGMQTGNDVSEYTKNITFTSAELVLDEGQYCLLTAETDDGINVTVHIDFHAFDQGIYDINNSESIAKWQKNFVKDPYGKIYEIIVEYDKSTTNQFTYSPSNYYALTSESGSYSWDHAKTNTDNKSVNIGLATIETDNYSIKKRTLYLDFINIETDTRCGGINGMYKLGDKVKLDENFFNLTLESENQMMGGKIHIKEVQAGTNTNSINYIIFKSEGFFNYCYFDIGDGYVLSIECNNGALSDIINSVS